MADLKIKIKGDASSLKNSVKSAKTSLSGLSASAGSMFKSMAGGVVGVATALGALALNAIRVNANFEQTAVSFKTMLKSGSLATKVLDDLTAFSTKTPFEPREVYAAAKTLLAFGTDVESINSIMQKLGDVSAGTGKDLNELARIYGKVFVKGKAQGEELNQMSEAGIPIIKELQKQYGVTAEEIFKMGAAGKISFGDIDTAFNNMTRDGGLFFDAMLAQSDTLNGRLSTLKGNWSELMKAIGDTGEAKKGVSFLNESVLGITELAKTKEKSGLRMMLGMIAESSKEVAGENMLNPLSWQQWITSHMIGGEIGLQNDLGTRKGATTAAEIAAYRKQVGEEVAAADDAKSRKEAMAAMLGSGQAATLLSAGNIGGGGTLASLGGDISGGGFSARMNIAQEQLNATIEIRELTREMVKNSTAMTNEGTMAYNRSKTDNIIK